MTKFAVLLAIYITAFVVGVAGSIGDPSECNGNDWFSVWAVFVLLAIPAALGFLIGKQSCEE